MPLSAAAIPMNLEEGRSNGESSISPPERLSTCEEVKLFLHIAIPLVAGSFVYKIPAFLSASYVGRWLGNEYLAALMLAQMTTNVCCGIITMGLLTASNTLQPQALAIGNNREVGVLSMRSFFWCNITLLPINLILWFFMEPIFVNFLHQDEFVSTQAWYWYRITAVSHPFTILFQVTWDFLYTQMIVWPLTLVTGVCSCLIFPVALHFLTLKYGFIGSAIAQVVLNVLQAILLLLYVGWKRPHAAETWPGLRAFTEAISWEASRRFLWLGIGGMLTKSEWLFWEVAGMLVGTLGALPLAVHAIPCQVINLLIMIDYCIGQTLSLRVAATLPLCVKRAKHLAFGCLLGSTVLFGLLSLSVYFFRYSIYRIFTKEQEVIDGCEQIWWMACLTYFMYAAYSVLWGNAVGLGLQWANAVAVVVFMWIISLPALLYFGYWKNGGLYATWFVFWSQFAAINVTLVICLLCTNWDRIAATINVEETSESGDKTDNGILVSVDKQTS